jgi:hypothetical protein
MKKVISIVLTLLLSVLAFSCKKTSTVTPGPPVVTFKDFSVLKETEAYFHFGFTDPDGDIGLKNSDTTGSFAFGSIYYNDFHMRLQILNRFGNWSDTAIFNPTTNKFDSLDFNYRIPYIDNKSKDKSLTGEVYVQMTGYRFVTTIKKFRYKFYIYDRAHNKSNVVTTPEFNYP